MRIAILDDDQNGARATADWLHVATPGEIFVTNKHLAGDDLLSFLAGAEAVVAMRERTPFGVALPNVIGLPHLGYVTAETYRACYRGAVEDIEAWRDGAPLRVLNP